MTGKPFASYTVLSYIEQKYAVVFLQYTNNGSLQSLKPPWCTSERQYFLLPRGQIHTKDPSFDRYSTERKKMAFAIKFSELSRTPPRNPPHI